MRRVEGEDCMLAGHRSCLEASVCWVYIEILPEKRIAEVSAKREGQRIGICCTFFVGEWVLT